MSRFIAGHEVALCGPKLGWAGRDWNWTNDDVRTAELGQGQRSVRHYGVDRSLCKLLLAQARLMYEGKVSSNQCNRWLQVGYDKKVGIRQTVYDNDNNNNSNPGDTKILRTPQVWLGEKGCLARVPARWWRVHPRWAQIAACIM